MGHDFDRKQKRGSDVELSELGRHQGGVLNRDFVQYGENLADNGLDRGCAPIQRQVGADGVEKLLTNIGSEDVKAAFDDGQDHFVQIIERAVSSASKNVTDW